MTSMPVEQLEVLLRKNSDIADVKVAGDGKHYELTIISDAFVDQSKVKRQLWVYALLNPYILSGELHAIQMNTWTTAEWQKINHP